jgi:hypothetical protein
MRFADDTRWIHDLLSFLNSHMERLIGLAPDNPPVPAPQPDDAPAPK